MHRVVWLLGMLLAKTMNCSSLLFDPFSSVRYSGAIVWGSNHIASHDLDPGHHEPSLRHLCQTRDDIDMIFIHGVLAHTTPYFIAVRNETASVDDDLDKPRVTKYPMPGLALGNHCIERYKNLHVQPGRSESALALLSCPSIGKDIAYCQRVKGKKIFLNVASSLGEATFKTPKEAQRAAWLYWQLFLGGSELLDVRPFGPAVQLDGLNIIPRDAPDHYDVFAQSLRSLMDGPPVPLRSFFLAITPKCSFPDAYVGTMLHGKKHLFDLIIVEFTASTDCSFAKQNHFWAALKKWNDWVLEAGEKSRPTQAIDSSALASTNGTLTIVSPLSPKIMSPVSTSPVLLIGLPASKVGGLSAPGDYISLPEYFKYQIFAELQKYPAIKGLYFLDYSCDNLNLPCIPTAGQSEADSSSKEEFSLPFKSYSSIFLSILNLHAKKQTKKNSGRLTVTAQDVEKMFQCKFKATSDLDSYWQLPEGFSNSPDAVIESKGRGMEEKKNLGDGHRQGVPRGKPPRKNEKPIKKQSKEDLKDYGCGPGVKKCFNPKGQRRLDNSKEESNDIYCAIPSLALLYVFFA